MDLDSYYITVKGGASKTRIQGETSFILYNGAPRALQNDDLGAFKGGTELSNNGVRYPALDRQRRINGGNIKTYELIIGLQYKF